MTANNSFEAELQQLHSLGKKKKNTTQLYARNYFINFAKERWDTGSHLIPTVFSLQETDPIKL